MVKTIEINKDITDHLSKNRDFILPKDEKWNIITRLSRSSGHLASIKSMIYQDENPKTVLAQLLAIKGAIDAIEKHYLCAYLSLAKEKLVKEGNETYLNDLKELIGTYLK